MKAKVLSVYNDYYEIKDFLLKYNFIDETQYNDDEYELLTWLEGDCDKMTCDGNEIFFGEFHSDYVWDDCFVVISTAEDDIEKEGIEEFFNGDDWVRYEGDVDDFEKMDRTKYELAWYRGGVGYFYTLYYREIV